VISFRGVSRDITDRTRAEEKLADALKDMEGQREKFRTLVDNAPFGMALVGKEGDFILINPRFKELFGYDEKDVPNGREWFKRAYPDPEYRREVIAAWITDMEKSNAGEKRPRVYTVTCKNGEEKIIHFIPVKLTTGEDIVSLEDITERVQSEDILRKSERLYRSVIENINDTFYRSDIDGKLIMMSPSGAALFDYDSVEYMIGADIAEFFYVNPEDRKKLLSEIQKHGFVKDYEIKLKRRDGTPVEISASSHLYYDEQGNLLGVEGILRDITERKRAEELYRTLAESSHAGVYIIQDRKVKFVNPRVLEYSGYSKDELIEKDVPNFVHPEDREMVRRNAIDMLKGKRMTPYEFRIIDRAGHTKWLMETVRSIIYEGKRAVLSNSMDITERYRLERMLQQAHKMESIGTLAGGIAHDFNNILGVMIGYADLARSDVRPEKQKYYLDQVLRACDRAKGLVSQILTFSRQSEQERKPIFITSLIKEGIKMLRSSLPSTIQITQDISPLSIVVSTDPTQIHQILMNLVTNAAHAMRDTGGILNIQLDIVRGLSSMTNHHLGLEAGDYALLRVSDTGHGMDASTMDRIFDPFYTTKGPGEGTGLGLSVVYGIVKNHGGVIDVSSDLKKGSTFSVYLPLIENQGKMSKVASEVISGGSERILFVDDEAGLIDVGSMMLMSLGYHVTSKTSSIEALEAFRTRPQDFDLVITDTTMPNMTGIDLARELLKIRPDIPIILCTGFSENMSEERAKSIGIRRFVMKPLFKKDLARVIREVLV